MIDPLFTESWLEAKLDKLFAQAVTDAENLSDSEAVAAVAAYAVALEHFHYQGATADQIEVQIWETAQTGGD